MKRKKNIKRSMRFPLEQNQTADFTCLQFNNNNKWEEKWLRFLCFGFRCFVCTNTHIQNNNNDIPRFSGPFFLQLVDSELILIVVIRVVDAQVAQPFMFVVGFVVIIQRWWTNERKKSENSNSSKLWLCNEKIPTRWHEKIQTRFHNSSFLHSFGSSKKLIDSIDFIHRSLKQ